MTARPVVGAEVFVLPSGHGEFAAALTAVQADLSPLLRSTTDGQGRFRIDIELAGPEALRDVWILAQAIVDTELRGVLVRAGTYADVGTIRAKAGAEIEGVVTNADGRPVERARVQVALPAQARSLSLLPEREHGVSTETDAQGRYRLRGAPFGNVDLVAVAPGYARSAKPAFRIARGSASRCDFVLAKGAPLRGRVVDVAERPVPAASVRVRRPEGPGTDTLTVTTAPDGWFVVEVPFGVAVELDVEHPGFERLSTESFLAAGARRRLVLHRLGSILVSVRGKTGWALEEFTATLCREVPGSDGYLHVDFPRQEVRTKPGEAATIEGIPPRRERYVLQVDAKDHARGYSDPFTVELDREPELVTVQLDAGGGLEGRVIGADGAPLAGAKVSTMPGLVPGSPDAARAVGLLPTRIAPRSTATDADGRYGLPLLTPGRYCLRIAHREHHDLVLADLPVVGGETRVVPEQRMRSGTIVRGIVRRRGVPTPVLGVTITTVEEAGRANPLSLSWSVRSGAGGDFAFAKPLPPGRYLVRAGTLARTDEHAPLAGALTSQPLDLDGRERERVLELAIDGE